MHEHSSVQCKTPCNIQIKISFTLKASYILIYIQKDATLHSLFFLETALHVSGGERKQLYLQHLVFVTPLLISASIVEELELVWVWWGWRIIPNQLYMFLAVFAHHQEHLTVFTLSGNIHPSCCQLVSWILPDSVNTVKCSWWWAKTLAETRRAD